MRSARHVAAMPAFLYRCPTTRMHIQGWIAEDPTKQDDTYRALTCTACMRVHLINSKTGKVLGEEE